MTSPCAKLGISAYSKSLKVGTGQKRHSEAFGGGSPVKTFSPTLYLEAQLKKGAVFVLPDGVEERAVYVVSGGLQASGTVIPQHCLASFASVSGVGLTAIEDCRLVVIGGRPLGKRTVWWNLVATRKDLIEKAKADWRAGRFPKIPGETEFIPLPGD